MMKRAAVVLGLVIAASGPLAAQRSWAYEAGLFGEYTKFADTTRLKSGVGAGARFGVFVIPRLALEYEASFIPTTTRTQSGIMDWSNRIDAVFNVPIGERTVLLVGGGWTGTNYKGDTTHNAYDSGPNAMLGIRRCMSQLWSWRLDAVADFKKPADQTPGDVMTQTYSGRFGVSWFLGGPAKNSPCYVTLSSLKPFCCSSYSPPISRKYPGGKFLWNSLIFGSSGVST